MKQHKRKAKEGRRRYRDEMELGNQGLKMTVEEWKREIGLGRNLKGQLDLERVFLGKR